MELKSGIGLFGVSMGAITGTVVAADLPDLEACVLVMGGGNLADILCTARDEVINEYRRDLSKRLGVTEGDLLPRIRAAIKGWDPLEHASKIETRRVFFVNTLFDPVVRPRFQALLWEALGRPERMRLPCGHYSAVIFVPVIKRAALKWMDRWLPGGDP